MAIVAAIPAIMAIVQGTATAAEIATVAIATVSTGLSTAGMVTKNPALSIAGGVTGLAAGGVGAIGGAATAPAEGAELLAGPAEEAASTAPAAAGSTAAAATSTAETIGKGLSGVAGVTNALAQYQSGQEAEAEAAQLRRQGRTAQRQSINKDLDTIGAQRATAGASGLEVSSGTPLAVFSDSIRQLEMNAANAKSTGEVQAMQRKREANLYYSGIPGAIASPLLQNKTLLSQFMGR